MTSPTNYYDDEKHRSKLREIRRAKKLLPRKPLKQGADAEYHRKKSQEWYEHNKAVQLKHSKITRRRRREWFREQYTSCEQCGIEDNRVLEWHHRDPSQKRFELSHGLSRYGKAALLEEIEKCMCICANCHRILHAEMEDVKYLNGE